jgi:hypothetical protein
MIDADENMLLKEKAVEVGAQDGVPGMRFTFDENDVVNFDRLRCYKLVILNKKASPSKIILTILNLTPSIYETSGTS